MRMVYSHDSEGTKRCRYREDISIKNQIYIRVGIQFRAQPEDLLCVHDDLANWFDYTTIGRGMDCIFSLLRSIIVLDHTWRTLLARLHWTLQISDNEKAALNTQAPTD